MRIRQIDLSEDARRALIQGYEHGNTARYRKRCHIILLKSDGKTASQIKDIVGLNTRSIYYWLDRYESEGIIGLKTKAGQGRPAILTEEHEAIVKECINEERQRLNLVIDDIRAQTGKDFSQMTLKRFLKNLTTPINASEKA